MRASVRVRPLTDAKYQRRERQAAARKMATGRVKRARFILLSDQGYLEVGPRTGRPPVYAPTDVGMVIQTALTPPDERTLPFGARTLDRLVAYLGEVKGIATAAPANSGVVCLDEIR
ncbi:MAG: hypothetical protein M3Y58_11630 [Chloroflexota bacterium]|nr:hypothetical protein [Chloroflexota bacterium]